MSVLLRYSFVFVSFCASLGTASLAGDWAYDGATITLAHLNVSFRDPKSGSIRTEAGEVGRFALGSVGTASGVLFLGHVSSKDNNNTLERHGCTRPWAFETPQEPWVALLSGGACTDRQKVSNALYFNASAVIIFAGENEEESVQRVVLPSFPRENGVVVFVGKQQGNKFARLVDSGTRVHVTIRKGQEVRFRVPNVNRTSVLFVSISFIVLMVISLAWLVFYYVQRFRYINHKAKLARHLCNAAKKALAKIPLKTLKAGDKELYPDSECCAVCIERYQTSETIRILPCSHHFHKNCVDPWLLEHRTCPMCKMDILKHYGFVIASAAERAPNNGDDSVSESVGSSQSQEENSSQVIIAPSSESIQEVATICQNVPSSIVPSVLPEGATAGGESSPTHTSLLKSVIYTAKARFAPSAKSFRSSQSPVPCNNLTIVEDLPSYDSHSLQRLPCEQEVEVTSISSYVVDNDAFQVLNAPSCNYLCRSESEDGGVHNRGFDEAPDEQAIPNIPCMSSCSEESNQECPNPRSISSNRRPKTGVILQPAFNRVSPTNQLHPRPFTSYFTTKNVDHSYDTSTNPSRPPRKPSSSSFMTLKDGQSNFKDSDNVSDV